MSETELKLALPAERADALAQRLARAPVLARCTPVQQRLVSIYHDTPALDLQRHRVALRLRSEGAPEDAAVPWLQTLKTAGSSTSALSQRGEWEMAVAGPALELDRLAATPDCPWAALDPQGRWGQALQPVFTTDFVRTAWTVSLRGGSVVEVALDVGQVLAGGRSSPLCELELELKAGPVQALWTLALRLARQVPMLPLSVSKAQRGFALLADPPPSPVVRAQPLVVARKASLPQILAQVLEAGLHQCTANLVPLQQGMNDAELVHQARVGWRRMRSLLRLLRPVWAHCPPPPADGLQSLWQALGAQRDLDVARLEVLPAWEAAFVAGDATRQALWQAAQQALEQAATAQRRRLQAVLVAPGTGRALLEWQAWAAAWGQEAPPLPVEMDHSPWALAPGRPTRRWLRARVQRLARRRQAAQEAAAQAPGPAAAEAQHRSRILAKRLRYGSEALAPLLRPSQRAWAQQAQSAQEQLGQARDLVLAAQTLVACAPAAAVAEVVAFLRGVAAGRTA